MKLNTHSSIENNTSFSSKSFGLEQTPFFFKILSSSLYERKEEAVLRELSANALDAHNMSGKKDTPIEILLPNELSPELIVKDYGEGMSLLSLENNFTVYGFSTKRFDNANVGGFGMGCKSPFALSDSFTVESTHEGITTKIACYLDEGHPKFSVFSSVRTDNPSGTTVRVPVTNKENHSNLIQAAQSIFFFWEVQPEIKGAKVTENLSKYLEYQDDTLTVLNRHAPIIPYSIIPYSIGSGLDHVSIGPFYYSLPSNLKTKINATETLREIYHLNLNGNRLSYILKFNIGELELSPSRERIEDTQENYNTIFSKLSDLVSTIKGNLKESITRTYYNLYKFILENGRKSSEYKLADKEEIINIDKQLVNQFFSEKLSTTSNPLTTVYLMSKVLGDAEETFKQSLELSDSEFSEVLKLNEKISQDLTTNQRLYNLSKKADNRFLNFEVAGYDWANLSVLKPYIPKDLEHTYVSRLFRQKLGTYTIEVTSNGTFRHSSISGMYNLSKQCLNCDKLFIIKGHRENKTTRMINQAIKHSLIDCPDPSQISANILVVYTLDNSVKDVAHDIKLLKGETDLEYFTLEDVEEVQNKVPKQTVNKSSSTTKVSLPRDERVLGGLLAFNGSTIKTVTISDVYDSNLHKEYSALVVLKSQYIINSYNPFPTVPQKEYLEKEILIVSLNNNAEKNTKRFKHFTEKFDTYLMVDNDYRFSSILNMLIKKGHKPSIKAFKEVVTDYVTNNILHDVQCPNTYTSKDYCLIHNKIFDTAITKEAVFDLHGINHYTRVASLKQKAYSHLVSKLPKKLKYILDYFREKVFLRYNHSKNIEECLKDIEQGLLTKSDTAQIKKALKQTKKYIGEKYDSLFKDIIDTHSNT